MPLHLSVSLFKLSLWFILRGVKGLPRPFKETLKLVLDLSVRTCF